jgi:hypothetical protein
MSNPEIVVYTPSPDSLADLAATAPELLAALQAINIEVTEDTGGLTRDDYEAIVLSIRDTARAAIAKATQPNPTQPTDTLKTPEQKKIEALQKLLKEAISLAADAWELADAYAGGESENADEIQKEIDRLEAKADALTE